MQVFPVFLHLAGRSCLVVGGGPVGCAKASRLAEAGAQVVIVEPHPRGELTDLEAALAAVVVRTRAFVEADCDGQALVFACTGDPDVNAAVAVAAQSRGVLACRADAAEAGDFSTGATLRRGEVCVAVSSGGASPHLAVAARDRIEPVVGEEFAEAAQLLGGLRQEVKVIVKDCAERREALGAKLAAKVLQLLGAGRAVEARQVVESARRAALEEGPCTQ